MAKEGAVTIPDYRTLMAPILRRLDDGADHQIRDLVEVLAADFDVTQDERNMRLPSTHFLFRNRVDWAVTYLIKADLAERCGRGVIRITQAGRAALGSNDTE